MSVRAGTGRVPCPVPGRRADERGSASVVVTGVICAVLLAVVGVAALMAAQAAAGRARLAADLAALGGATALSSVLAPGDPCATAGAVASANGARLTGCQVLGEDVIVQVSVPVRVLGRQATAAARAGPVEAAGG